MTGPADLYRYKATLIPWDPAAGPTAWHDGDTFNADVDLGCHVHWHGHVRCAGYNAPEVYGTSKPAGLVAKAYAESLVDTGGVVDLNSLAFESNQEEDNFGRMIAAVTLADGTDLCTAMITAGQAVPDP